MIICDPGCILQNRMVYLGLCRCWKPRIISLWLDLCRCNHFPELYAFCMLPRPERKTVNLYRRGLIFPLYRSIRLRTPMVPVFTHEENALWNFQKFLRTLIPSFRSYLFIHVFVYIYPALSEGYNLHVFLRFCFLLALFIYFLFVYVI